MTLKKKQSEQNSTALLAPDKITTQYVGKQLEKVGIFPENTVTGPRQLKNFAARKREKIHTLVLIPSLNLGIEQLQLVRHVTKNNGLVLTWITNESACETANFDDWLLERLVEEAGARSTPRIDVLAEAVRFSSYGFKPDTKHFRLMGRKSAIVSRVLSVLVSTGFNDTTSKKSALEIRINPEGTIRIETQHSSPVELGDPWTAAEALKLVSAGRPEKNPGNFNPKSPSREAIESIAQPPPRLLSEITSKRLASYFGIENPREKLCHSATEATRYAATIDGPVVLKLVRPELENKAAIGGVQINIVGPSAIRRAVHGLESMGKSMTPPKPLGILVAEQVSYETATWLKMLDHSIFGRIVLMGIGESPSENPRVALPATSSFENAHLALRNLEGIIPAEDCGRLAAAMAYFCQMVHTLGNRINRAEIHPLITLEGHGEALALDALIRIGHP